MKKRYIIFIAIGIILLILSIIEGFFIYLLITIFILVFLSYILDFIKKNFPKSNIGKLVSRILKFFHEFFENLLGWF